MGGGRSRASISPASTRSFFGLLGLIARKHSSPTVSRNSHLQRPELLCERSTLRPPHRSRQLLAFVAPLIWACSAFAGSQPVNVQVFDLADLNLSVDPVTRVLGLDDNTGIGGGIGSFGVPVAGGVDFDGDGLNDAAIAHMLASPLGRNRAGQVSVLFGDGTIGGEVDLELSNPDVLTIIGAGNLGTFEMAGSEIWAGDVTNDGIGDLLVCRQNYSVDESPNPRYGAGALTIIVGSPQLRTLAASGTTIDLANPPTSIEVFTIVGPHAHSRLGIWTRVGDIDNDGSLDIVVGADQESSGAVIRHGAVYVIRGGSHLNTTTLVDLADFGSTSLAGNIARIEPPFGSAGYHVGGTVQVGDLDNNGRDDVMIAATLNRAGASIGPFGPNFSTTRASGGPPGGRGEVYIVWDDAFPAAPWPAGLNYDLSTTPDVTQIIGGTSNDSFGEELLGGLDYSGDGLAEFFVGDLVGDANGLNNLGLGFVFYNAALLKGLSFDVDNPPNGIELSRLYGPVAGAIGSDTAAHGDFNGDGIADLMVGSPHDNPQDRFHAGAMHILFGQLGGWPAEIDTAVGEIPAGIAHVTLIEGALGQMPGGDSGDTLCYSAAAGDLDGDGKIDILANEMQGNGASPDAVDSGNLLIISGAFISPPTVIRNVAFARGDANGDGSVTPLADAIYLLDYLFNNGPAPLCLETIDLDGDGQLGGIAEPIYLLNYQFSGGPAPASPFPGCDLDADLGTSLGCDVGCP